MKNLNYALMTGPAEKLLPKIPGELVDLVLTSSPYDSVRDYMGHTFNWRVFTKIAKELYRVLKPGGTLVWVVADQTINGQETGTSFRQALHFRDKVGFMQYDTMIYYRKKAPLTHRRYEQAFEYIFVMTKGVPKTFNGLREPKEYPEKTARKKNWQRWADGSFKNRENRVDTNTRLRYNVFYYPSGIRAEEKFAHNHPAMFPEELALDQIVTWSNVGDVVLDPFCGSGTTGKMALFAGRKFIGIEISSEYMAITKERIEVNRDKRFFAR